MPIAAVCGAYQETGVIEGLIIKRYYHFTWRWMWLWDNWEDGIANATYVKFNSMFMKIVYWSCFRNPINNMRATPYLSCKVNPERVNFIGRIDGFDRITRADADGREYYIRQFDTKIPQRFFAWQSIWHSNYYKQFVWGGELWRFWIGSAKIYPDDIWRQDFGYRKMGTTAFVQFKRVQ